MAIAGGRRVAWMTSPRRERRARVVTVTSTNGGREGTRRQSAGGGPVAQDRAGPGGEQRGAQATPFAERRVADGVHAAVDDDQPILAHPVVDRRGAQSEVHELRPFDDAVLPRREPRDQRVNVGTGAPLAALRR